MIKYNIVMESEYATRYTCVYNNWFKDNMGIGWHIALNEIH